jgi:N-acetylglucosaminyl-diphospho-decaprenol L-rhamnosyltransferase
VNGRRLATIVVTYNSENVIADCLASLDAARDEVEQHTVIVVDNHSTDATCDLVERHAPQARLLRLDRNGGYASGINAGAAVAGDVDAVLVLNPDARLAPGAVTALMAAMALPDTGIAVPTVHGPNGSIDLSLRREPTVLRVWGEAILGGIRAGRFQALGEIVSRPEPYGAPQIVDWASGSAMLISRRCHDAVGGWDESFFLYSEETDFCLRARDRGWLVRYTPEASVMHIGGHGERTPLRALMVANRVELFGRRSGAVRAVAFRAALVVHEALRSGRGPHYRAATWALLTRRRPIPPDEVTQLVSREPSARRSGQRRAKR